MSGLISISKFCTEYSVGRTRAFALLAEKKLVARRFGARTLIEQESARAWAASLPKWESTRVADPSDRDDA